MQEFLTDALFFEIVYPLAKLILIDMKNPFTPPPAIEPLPPEKVNSAYKSLRLKVFMGIFIGYAGFYLIRKIFSFAMPYLEKEGFDKSDLGLALSAIAYSYGLSKFLMGSVSDRSNARTFLPFGLAVSALLIIGFGLFSTLTSTIFAMACVLFAFGWFQGMGWPPCGRVMVHWFSTNERGLKMSIWNVAHNVGGLIMPYLVILGMYLFSDNWRTGIFVFPAVITLSVALIAWLLIRDTPQSCGLPPIEVFRNDFSRKYSAEDEKEFSTREIFMEHVLNNKALWAIAIANAFVYFVRYGILDWAPLYLQNVKDFNFSKSGFAYFGFELAGIIGTILCGWISDKIFKGKRAPVNAIFMALTAIAIVVYWLNPKGCPMIDMVALFAIGFLIYGPVMLIGLQALDMVSKKAAGTAAGFTGFFGYFLGTATLANLGMGYVTEHLGWNWSFAIIIGACVITILIMIKCSIDEHKQA